MWLLYGVAAFTIWICIRTVRSLRSPISKIPGPEYSKFTPVWLIFQEFTANRRLYVHQLHQKYGPVVRLGPNEVSFTSVDAIKEIYTTGGSGYDKTELYNLFKQFGFRTLFSTLTKGDHSQKKRYIASPYANTNIMRPKVLGGIQNRADAFIQKCTESLGKSMDVYVSLHGYALDCATHILFHPYGTHAIENKEDFKLVQELSFHNSLQIFLSLYYFERLVNLLLKIIKTRPAPLSREYVFKACKGPEPSETTVVYRLRNSKGAFTPGQIAAECMDHMAAGIDTTGDALCFLMYQISRPESSYVQEKLSQEFEAKKDKPLDELEYLDIVIKEGLRCFPPIPMSQPRYVPKGGSTIDDYFVPEGTIVSCQAHSIHRLNERIYPKGDKFIPERWLDEERSVDMNRLFFSFNTGARGCTGRHLAMAEMKILLREVYSQFRTRIADDMRGRMDISDQIISSRPLDQTCKLVFERI